MSKRTVVALPMSPRQRLELYRCFSSVVQPASDFGLLAVTITGHEYPIMYNTRGSRIPFEELNSLCRDKTKQLAGWFGHIYIDRRPRHGLVTYSFDDNQIVQLYTDNRGRQQYWLSDAIADFIQV